MALSKIRTNYHATSEALINKQINMELHASYVYMSMVSHFGGKLLIEYRFVLVTTKLSPFHVIYVQKFCLIWCRLPTSTVMMLPYKDLQSDSAKILMKNVSMLKSSLIISK